MLITADHITVHREKKTFFGYYGQGTCLCNHVRVLSSSLQKQMMINWFTVKPEQTFPCSHKPPCLIKHCILTQCRMLGLCLSMSIHHCCIIYWCYLCLVESKYSGVRISILTRILPIIDTSQITLLFSKMWICQPQLFNVSYHLFLSMFIFHLLKKYIYNL